MICCHELSHVIITYRKLSSVKNHNFLIFYDKYFKYLMVSWVTLWWSFFTNVLFFTFECFFLGVLFELVKIFDMFVNKQERLTILRKSEQEVQKYKKK